MGVFESLSSPEAGDERPVLIVNADDFGMTPGVCLGVLAAHAGGIVTSTSALAVGPAFDRFAPALRDSGLPVGGHLAAVGEDPPVLTAREVPSLLVAGGRFPTTWQEFMRRAVTGRVDTDDLRREFNAQIEKLGDAGLRLTHLDSHQNLHLWPQVATVVIEIALARRIGAVRLTRSERWNPTSLGVRVLSRRLALRATRCGLAYPETSSGLDEAGSPDVEQLMGTIRRLRRDGAGAAELVTHLAQDPDPDRSRYASRFAWADELAAICDPRVGRAVEEAGFRLGSFADISSGDHAARR